MAIPASVREPRLVCVDLPVPGSNRRGRAFLHADRLAVVGCDELEAAFGRSFFDEDDQVRLSLLERALLQGTVSVDICPGETSPVEFHAYLRAPGVSATRIFACVLAPTAVVEQLISMPPHIVFETATLQVIGGEASPAALKSGLEAWTTRMWPESAVPKIRLRQWPYTDGGIEAVAELLKRWETIHLTAKPMPGAPPTLSASDFQSGGEVGLP